MFYIKYHGISLFVNNNFLTVNSIGIEVPQALLAQIMKNTESHYTSADARDLELPELLAN